MTRDRLVRAIEALRAVHAGATPDLTDAPMIDCWTVVEIDGCAALAGNVIGHPDFVDGRLVATSALLALADHEGWARTVTRFYRLGQPYGERRGVH